MDLYPYQDDAQTQVRAARESGEGRALLHLAPGLGKTIIAAVDVLDYLTTDRPDARVFVGAHRRRILQQNESTFRWVAREVLGVDITTGFATSYGVTNPDAQFIFGSFGYMHGHLGDYEPDTFDYFVHDESHHDPAPTYRAAATYFQPMFRLGLTGSSTRLDRRPITEIYGEPVVSIPMARALARGYLPQLNYYLVAAGFQPLQFATGQRVTRDMVDEYFSVSEINMGQLVLREMQQRLGRVPRSGTLFFERTIAHAKAFAAIVGGEIVHSQMSPTEVDAALARFESSGAAYLTSVDMLNEGADFRGRVINEVHLIRGTASEALWEQQVGRGLRHAAGKTGVDVFDWVGSLERILMVRELAAAIEEEAAIYNDELNTRGDREITFEASPVHIVIDREAVDIVERLEQSTRPKPPTRQEALNIVIEWMRHHDGRIPILEDFIASLRLPSYDRIIDLWSDTPPAKKAFNAAVREAYAAAREQWLADGMTAEEIPEVLNDLRPEPASVGELMGLLVPWVGAHEGRIPIVDDFQFDGTLPAYSRALSFWRGQGNRKQLLNEALRTSYEAARAEDSTMPELQSQIAKPRPATRELFLDLVVTWMSHNNGKVPTGPVYTTNIELPTRAHAVSLYASKPDPAAALYRAVEAEYLARRARNPGWPAIIMPLHKLRPVPRDRDDALDMVVDMMVAAGGHNIDSTAFTRRSDVPSTTTVRKFFLKETVPFRAMLSMAQRRYIERAALDPSMPAPQFELLQPVVHSKEEVLAIVVPWMRNHGGNVPIQREFREDHSLPYVEDLVRLWSGEQPTPLRAFRAEAGRAYDARASREVGWPKPDRKVVRPIMTTTDQVITAAVVWMQRNNAERAPTSTDFLADELMPHYWEAMKLFQVLARDGERAKDVFNRMLYAAYARDVDPNFRAPGLPDPRPVITSAEDAVTFVGVWVMEHDGNFPNDSNFYIDRELPLWSEVEQYFPTIDALREAVIAEVAPFPVNEIARRRPRPAPVSREATVTHAIAWMSRHGRRSVSGNDLVTAGGLPSPQHIASLWPGDDPTDEFIAAVDAEIVRRVTESPGTARKGTTGRPNLPSREAVLAGIVPWMRAHGGRAPLGSDLADPSLPTTDRIGELWPGDRDAFVRAALDNYAAVRETDDPPPNMLQRARHDPPTSQAEAIARAAEWMEAHGGQMPGDTVLKYSERDRLFPAKIVGKLWADGPEGEHAKTRFNRDLAAEYERRRGVNSALPEMQPLQTRTPRNRPVFATAEERHATILDWASEKGYAPGKYDFERDFSLPGRPVVMADQGPGPNPMRRLQARVNEELGLDPAAAPRRGRWVNRDVPVTNTPATPLEGPGRDGEDGSGEDGGPAHRGPPAPSGPGGGPRKPGSPLGGARLAESQITHTAQVPGKAATSAASDRSGEDPTPADPDQSALGTVTNGSNGKPNCRADGNDGEPGAHLDPLGYVSRVRRRHGEGVANQVTAGNSATRENNSLHSVSHAARATEFTTPARAEPDARAELSGRGEPTSAVPVSKRSKPLSPEAEPETVGIGLSLSHGG